MTDMTVLAIRSDNDKINKITWIKKSGEAKETRRLEHLYISLDILFLTKKVPRSYLSAFFFTSMSHGVSRMPDTHVKQFFWTSMSHGVSGRERSDSTLCSVYRQG
jgi:hypothetical protein